MFTLYSKTGCPYCDKIEKVLKMKDLEYKKLLLNCEFNRTEFLEHFGEDATFPRVLDDNGQLIGGATETVAYLKKNGIL